LEFLKFQIPNASQVAQQNLKPKLKNQKPADVSIINQNQNNQIVEVITKQQEIQQPFISQEVVISNQKNDIAEVEILVKKEKPITKIKVNATSLLSQVDGELNQSFRESKLEKIARNLNTVKVALANRNKE
jgi:spermidine/putrescine-binding protein